MLQDPFMSAQMVHFLIFPHSATESRLSKCYARKWSFQAGDIIIKVLVKLKPEKHNENNPIFNTYPLLNSCVLRDRGMRFHPWRQWA